MIITFWLCIIESKHIHVHYDEKGKCASAMQAAVGKLFRESTSKKKKYPSQSFPSNDFIHGSIDQQATSKWYRQNE